MFPSSGLQHQDGATARGQMHLPDSVDGYLFMAIVPRDAVRVDAVDINFALLGADTQTGEIDDQVTLVPVSESADIPLVPTPGWRR